MDSHMRDDYIVPMVDRALYIIKYLYNKRNSAGVAEISKELNFPKATVYKILYTLNKHDFIQQKEDDTYQLGMAFLNYGTRVKSSIDLGEIAHPILEKYALITGESFNVSVRYKNFSVVVERVSGEKFFLIDNLIPISPLHCSSVGKIYLAHMQQDELEDYFSMSKLEKKTVNTIQTIEEFLPQQKRILDSNISIDEEEYEYGLTCFGRGIFQSEKKEPIITMSLSGPTTRIRHKGEEFLISKLIEATRELEESIDTLGTKYGI